MCILNIKNRSCLCPIARPVDMCIVPVVDNPVVGSLLDNLVFVAAFAGMF